jgi:transketolase
LAPNKPSIEQLSINTIRTLTVDAVQAAQSGHPGAPLGLAPAAYLLYTRIMKHNPADPKWADRDRFVLSAGHASMLLYSCLYLSGYDLSLDDIKQFRQLGSRTPGHPENFETPGVETTTGPLGQGFGNAVGMAMAEEFLRERYSEEVCDHRIFAICSDGDLMEGVASEAASLAGHLKLGRCVFLYDDNKVTIDGSTDLSFSQEDVPKRFDAYGWHTHTVEDGNDLEAIEAAIRAGIAEEDRPTLISLKTVIGYGSPRAGTRNAHSDPMPEEQVRATKEALGWDPDAQFLVPEEVLAHFDQRERGAAAQKEWEAHLERWSTKNVEAAAEWHDAQTGRPSAGAIAALPVFDADPKGISTRVAGRDVMQAFAPYVPTMIGGAADLIHSTFTMFNDDPGFTPDHAGRNVAWGVREHGMGAAVNGLALHGGIVKPFCSTFFVFTDYMRPPIRLSALMRLDCVWIFSHDSVAVGEDGPTHQPVEHLAAMRAIPNLTVIRPADANETAEAWGAILEDLSGPVCLVLSRQNVPTIDRAVLAPASGLRRGAYVLAEVDSPDVVLVATGAEVGTALAASELLADQGMQARVVSMPSWELFEDQRPEYREDVLPADVPKISVEAATTFGWSRWVDASIGIDTFGASGKGDKVLEHFGISPASVAERVQVTIAALAQL